MSERKRVRVPGSTSNLGPGFDMLGLALSLWLEVEAEVIDGAHRVRELEGTARDWPREHNLVHRAFDAGLECLGAAPRGLEISARSEIPIGRGLGSSGAAVAAGLALAAHVAGAEPDAPELCVLGCEIEGHPDNSTASLLGGCTLALPHGGGLSVVRQALHPSLGFALAWPRAALSTTAARQVLPERVPFAHAIENPRRLAMLLEGLRRGDPELVGLGLVDRLHVAHRLPLIPGGAQAIEAARAAGAWGATVSGSGSALVALGAAGSMSPIAEAMSSALDGAEGCVVEPVLTPARVQPA
jgi:homoserine kinase